MIVGHDQQLIVSFFHNDTRSGRRHRLCISVAKEGTGSGRIIDNRYHGRHDFFHHAGDIISHICDLTYIGKYIARRRLLLGLNLRRHFIPAFLRQQSVCSQLNRIEPGPRKQSEHKPQTQAQHKLTEHTSFFLLSFCRIS